LETNERSTKRKEMVSRLINLRIRLQDLRDKQERPGEKDAQQVGLRFL